MRLWVVEDQVLGNLKFLWVDRGRDHTDHFKITEEGNAVFIRKEKGLHVEPFLILPREMGIQFLKEMINCARQYGLKIPEDYNNGVVDGLKGDKQWLQSIVEKLIDE